MLDRAWCESIASKCLMQQIRPQAEPYLDRYFVAGWSPANQVPGPALFLHHFVGSDPADAVHSHPWNATSIILAGSYREYRCDGDGLAVRDFFPGDINQIQVNDRHRILLLTPDVWTLFLVSDYVQPWRFYAAC